MNFKDQLKQAGLTENEALVYQTLLEIGPKTATTLAKRTGLHRRLIYDITDRLIKKGIIGYILENKKKIFSASNPKRFSEILNEKQQAIDSIMPNMISMFNQEISKEKQETNFFKGIEGLKSVFEDQLNYKEIFIIGASPLAYEMLDIYFHWFDKKRQKNKIKTKIIFNKLAKNQKIKKIPLSEIKYLPEKYSSNLAINIYGDKTAIILWKKQKPIAIVIKDKEITQGYKKHFELMWRLAKKG